MKTLFEAFSDEAAPPCEKFSCPEYQRCADELLACEAFVLYAQTGRSIHPHNAISSTSAKAAFMGQVEPTSEIFQKMEHDRWWRVEA